MNCEYCKEDLGDVLNGNAHLRSCKVYRDYIKDCENIMTKDYLMEHYIKNGESIAHISKSLGLKKTRLVEKKLKEYNIKKRNIQEAKKQKHHIELAKKTSLERYGYEFHTSSQEIINKRIETNLEKYGVENVFQSEEIKDKMKETCLEKYGVEHAGSSDVVREKIKETFLEKYGVDNPFSNKDIHKKTMLSRIKNGTIVTFVSKMSQDLFLEIYELLTDDDKENCYFHELNKEFGKWVGDNYCMYDFVLTNKNKCIEFNGDYYHMNPKIYESNEYNKKVGLTAKQIWEKDKIKIDGISDLGFEVLVVWEKELNNDKDKLIEKMLNFINS